MKPRELRACPVKGCPWRGADPSMCPMHAADEAWERQSQLRLTNTPRAFLNRQHGEP